MSQPTCEAVDEESAESLFRRVMAGATDGIWNLGADEEALAALYDVVDEAIRRKEAAEDDQGSRPE